MPFLATLGGKIGMGLLSVALIAGAIYAYNARQQSIGYNEAKEEIHGQIQEQAAQVQVHSDAQEASRIEGLERMIAEKDKFNAAMLRENRQLKAKLTKEPDVIHEVQYVEVETPIYSQLYEPCVVPDPLVDRVDELARVLNAIPYDRMPGGEEAAQEPAPSGLAPVACLALVARIETLTSRLGNVIIAHRALSEDAVKQYELYDAFKKGQMDEMARATRPNN